MIFTTWIWGDKYNKSAVRKLYAGIKRNYSKSFRFVVFTDRPRAFDAPIEVYSIRDLDLIGRGCLCRLRMFDPQWQSDYCFDDTIVNLDLDLVITGNVDEIFKFGYPFRILSDVNKLNPNPFNGSLMQLHPGCHSEVWTDFSLDALKAAPVHEFADDQGWIWHKLPQAAGWKAGAESGIYAFMKKGWPGGVGKELPQDARIVAFVGHRKPWMFEGLPWIRKYWVE